MVEGAKRYSRKGRRLYIYGLYQEERKKQNERPNGVKERRDLSARLDLSNKREWCLFLCLLSFLSPRFLSYNCGWTQESDKSLVGAKLIKPLPPYIGGLSGPSPLRGPSAGVPGRGEMNMLGIS